ncbi:MAG: pilus assembly protein TadG-related protein [Bradymonadaceae bacterium]
MQNIHEDRDKGPGARVARLHGDEGGAVLLLSLAGILILMLMAWVVMDAGEATRKKLDAQAAADTAAFSQASVKARAMNMMAYSNIAKRSIVSIYALYEGMYFAYTFWLIEPNEECTATNDPAACAIVQRNAEVYNEESTRDYEAYKANTKYYRADLQAIDNYQTYLEWMAPWWGWSEAVTRAQRNRATLATSYPPPPGSGRIMTPNLIQRVSQAAGPGAGHNIANYVDQLPVVPGSLDDLFHTGMRGNKAWLEFEHPLNIKHHKERSQADAAEDHVIQPGGTRYFTLGMVRAERELGRFANPRKLKTYLDANSDRWLHDTSNIVFVFLEGQGTYSTMRQKYSVPDGGEYDPNQDSTRMKSYRPEGYWAMARGEISYHHEDEPDLWRAAWTARLRPVALPDEHWQGGYDLNSVFHATLNQLAFSALIGSRGIDSVDRLFDDLVYMERVTRAMGQSTVEGTGK